MKRAVAALVSLVALAAMLTASPSAGAGITDVASQTVEVKRYIVVLEGQWSTDGSFSPAGSITAAVAAAGGTVTENLTDQIGVLVVTSPNAAFADVLNASPLVDVVAEDFAWKAFPTYEEAVSSGGLTVVASHDPCAPPATCPPGGPEETADPLEPLQWGMRMIRAPEAHAIQAGSRAVDVGILDTGIDGRHVDFTTDTLGTNVDCARGRDFIPAGPGVGNPDPCTDNGYHGTHVGGIVAAQANGIGVVGAAPNVTLVPVKVCDSIGYCYASSTAAGITYAGDAKLDVINMSFFVDDDTFQQSTEFKCMSDPVQRAMRLANERAIQYARNQGVVPVAALGNSDNDLAHPPEPYENECEVVPAETEGVIGTASLGPTSEKAFYSNYGYFATDVTAPGGNSRTPNSEIPGPCGNQIVSTIPGNLYACIQGTSMASPHAAGVAALIVSSYGRIGNDAGEPDVVMRPQEVEAHLQGTTIDIGLPGYDECFGNGRIDALRAVTHDTSQLYQPNEPCPEYAEGPNDGA